MRKFPLATFDLAVVEALGIPDQGRLLSCRLSRLCLQNKQVFLIEDVTLLGVDIVLRVGLYLNYVSEVEMRETRPLLSEVSLTIVESKLILFSLWVAWLKISDSKLRVVVLSFNGHRDRHLIDEAGIFQRQLIILSIFEDM